MPVVILHGRNVVDIDDRVAEIVRNGDQHGLNSTTISVDQSDLGEISAAISTPGFFGAERTVVLRGMPGVDRSPGVEWDDLEGLLVQQPATMTVLVAGQKIPANRKSIKAAKANGWTVELHDLRYGRELVAWTAQRAAKVGAAIDEAACAELLNRLFPTAWQREDRWNPQTIDMRLIATEVEKLASGSPDGVINRASVVELVADRAGVTAFKLNDETFEGRAAAALAELDKVLANGEAPERVIGQIGYQPAVLYAAGYVQRYGPDAVAQASGISVGQLKATVGRKSAWRNRPGQGSAVESLRRAEWLVKTGRAASSESVLVPLIAEIAEGFKK